VAVETTPAATVSITEVAPWSSGTTNVAADWFEVTNYGTTAIDITGWKVDDNSNLFTAALPLNGITSIAPGESVIFLETSATNAATIIANFISTWFGNNPPANLQVGSYTGASIGLSTGGDAVNLYDANGNLKANVVFGTATTNFSFNNAAGLNNATITLLSQIGVNGAFAAINDLTQIGSPGNVGKLIISEVAPWASGSSPVAADWFELTNTKAITLNITGWKVDDNSQSPVAAVALSGITTINPGESVIFIETTDLPGKTAAFKSNWFGTNPPAGLRIGNYTGSGIGLGTGGDQVNIYNATGTTPEASVVFGASPTTTFATFDNTAGLNSTTTAVTALSAVGVNGAFVAVNSATEIGSPGAYVITNPNLNIVDPSMNTNEMKIVAYPNPASSDFQLNLINGTEEKVAIKIYDMMGRLLELHTVNSIEVSNQKLGANLPSGIYNVVVNQGEVSKSVRVIKN
jgi:hypothetical protein